VNGAVGYLRGAFIAYEPDGYPDKKRVIPFRFNPESLSRTVAVEAGQSGGGVEGAAPGAAAAPAAEASADSGGAIKESFSVQIRLDFADREQSVSGLDKEFGIAPEIAAIEDLLYPAETESEASSDGTEPVRTTRKRPTVLFVWGRKRVLPVRIASLKIDETLYNNHLNPVRAEIDASLEVLGETEAKDNQAVRSALDHTAAGRRELAQMYYDNTASQGSNILPL
jgi:Contractile injection system tube protein